MPGSPAAMLQRILPTLRTRWTRADLPAIVAVMGIAALPALSLLGSSGAVLADPGSEVPIKLWGFETFLRVGLLGGAVPESAFPHGGVLNNPDPLGTIVTAMLRPWLGRTGAYNLLVVMQLQANAVAMWLLVRDLTRERTAGILAATAFSLTPLVLVYSVSGAITDTLHLWPYPLAIRAFLRGGWGGGAQAGAWLGAGVATCPYNVVVIGGSAVPLLFLARTLTRAALVRAVLALGVSASLIGAPFALRTRALTRDPGAQVSTESIAASRHTAPWPFLRPDHVDRYTATLADYVAIGKEARIERNAGSRYFRAFSPGLALLAFAALGLARRTRIAAPWAGMALWAALASLGPFPALTPSLAAEVPWNPVWQGLNMAFPGAGLLLEPFRYGLGVAFGLAVCAGIGVATLRSATARLLATMVWLVELAVLSPVPIPLPIATMTIPSMFTRLDALPSGAIVELPFFDRGTDRFRRIHFLHQLAHRRPIPDEVIGSPPRAFVENHFLGLLVSREKPPGRLQIATPDATRIEADRADLRRLGFAAIVVTPTGYANEAIRDEVLGLLAPLGPPEDEGGTLVFRVPE